MISHNLNNGSASNLDRVNRGEGINHDKTDFPTSRAQAIKRAVFLQVFGPYCILQIAPELVSIVRGGFPILQREAMSLHIDFADLCE